MNLPIFSSICIAARIVITPPISQQVGTTFTSGSRHNVSLKDGSRLRLRCRHQRPSSFTVSMVFNDCNDVVVVARRHHLRWGRKDPVVHLLSAKYGRGRRRRRFVVKLNCFGLDRHPFLGHSLAAFRSSSLELPTRFADDVSFVRHHRFANLDELRGSVRRWGRSVATLRGSVLNGRVEVTTVSRN